MLVSTVCVQPTDVHILSTLGRPGRPLYTMIGRPIVIRPLDDIPRENTPAMMSQMYDEAMDKDHPWHKESKHCQEVIIS